MMLVDLRGIQRPELLNRKNLPAGIVAVAIDPPSPRHVWDGAQWEGPPEFVQERAAAEAAALLARTDYVVVKAMERHTVLAPAWLDWRESLRDVVRGNSTAIGEEPPRYT